MSKVASFHFEDPRSDFEAAPKMGICFRVSMMLTLLLAAAASVVESYSTGFVTRGFHFPAQEDSSSSSGKFLPFLVSKNRAFATGLLEDAKGMGSFTFAIVGVDEKQQVSSTTSGLSALDTIWMANRNNPIQGNPPGSIVFDNTTGNLLLLTSTGETAWSSEAPGAGDVLELMNSGNLVLRTNNTSGAAVLWQSFDHPTDTLMQGQNFTGGMKLVSSISRTDPRSGPYSLEVGGDRLILYAAFGGAGTVGEPYWVNAALQEPAQLQSSKGAMYVRIQDGFLGMYQSEKRRVNFVPFASLNRLSNLTRRARVDPDGNFRVYYWQDGELVVDYEGVNSPCDYPDACGEYGICSVDGLGLLKKKNCRCPEGAFAATASTQLNVSFVALNSSDFSQGCVPKSPPKFCSSSMFEQDEFVELKGVDYFANAFVLSLNGTHSVEQCRNACLKSCSCKAFFFRNDAGSCFHTEQMRSMLKSANMQDTAYIKVKNPLETSVSARLSGGGSSRRKRTAVGIALLILVLLSVISSIALGCYYYAKRQKKDEDHSDEEAFLDSLPGLPKRFSYTELESATGGFRKEVHDDGISRYHGVLTNNARVCIVQLDVAGTMGRREFQSEVAAIASIGHHVNLVALCGYCVHGNDYFLVYDLVARKNGSLLDGRILDSNTKLSIALGMARGLAFVHKNACKGVNVHGNLVPHNVLLDENFVPKLAHYGLFNLAPAKLVGGGQQSAYMAPELRSENKLAEAASDVYAFGVILLELVTGHTKLPEDDNQEGSAEVQRCIEVAKCCTQQDPLLRPSMAMVVEMLEGRREIPSTQKMSGKRFTSFSIQTANSRM